MASMTGFHLASMMVQTKVVKTVWSSAETKADCLVLMKVVQMVGSSVETMAGMKADCLALPTAENLEPRTLRVKDSVEYLELRSRKADRKAVR